MAEVKTPLTRLDPWEAYCADEEGAWVIEPHHTHSDILRYVIADIGREDALVLLGSIECQKTREVGV